MGSNNFESQIKQKLENSTTEPSSAAWDKLGLMLDAADKMNNKHKNYWIYFAASFVGFLLMCTVFFKGFETEKINLSRPLVKEYKTPIISPEKEEVRNDLVAPSQRLNQTKIVRQVVAENTNVHRQSKKTTYKERLSFNRNELKEDKIIGDSSGNSSSQSLNNNKYITAEKLLAEVSDTKFEDIAIDRTHDRSKKGTVINPNSLLSSAETELNQTFRESALERINKNFSAVKTALVNRNYQD